MKLQNLIIVFIIIILPVVAVMSSYINYEIRTIDKQSMYNSSIISALHDAVYAFEADTQDNRFSKDPELKKSVLKSCVKVFENSFSNSCNIEFYGNEMLEKYIPAMMFGMYDGFYLYAPYKTANGYKHELRNYVYYTETIPNTDITIRYSLDNYMVVSGTFKQDMYGTNYNGNGEYITQSGYWVDYDKIKNYIAGNGSIPRETIPEYKSYDVNEQRIIDNPESISDDAKKYYDQTVLFTNWFLGNIKYNQKVYNNVNYFEKTSDPEDINSPFVEHKRQLMKEKIQSVLNTSITSYAKNSGTDYKMPVLSEEDWQKIYSDISFVTFVQGMNLGFKKYNGYCVMNSTNNSEYVNPNLLRFIYNNEYHDIRCSKIYDKLSNGYKIGDFRKYNVDVKEENESNSSTTKRIYYFKHEATACYGCINGYSTLPVRNSSESTYNYIINSSDENLKKSYFTSVARERWHMQQIYDNLNLLKD